MRRLGLLITLLGALLAPTSPAGAAAGCQAPPGVSAVDQYCETVPGATGDGGASTGGGNSTPSTGATLPRATAARLRAAGPTGQAILVTPAASTAKPRSSDEGKAKHPGSAEAVPTKSTPVRTSEPSDNPLSAVSHAAGGSRVGAGFIGLLGAGVLGMAAWGWAAFRRPGSPV